MVAPVINMPNTVKHNGISGIPTQLLVLHSAECPLRGGYAQSLTSWANVPLEQGGPVASWQRFVDPIARVRMVPDQYAAWHASEANPMSIGWEQAGYAAFSRAQWETPEGLKQLDNLAYDMAEVARRDGIPPVWLTTDQVEAVTHRGNRSIKGFCIHAQIDPDMRTDPGSNYPYDRLMDRIKHYLGSNGAAIAPQSGNIKPAKPAPKPAPKKEWYEMAKLDNDVLVQIHDAVHHGAPGAKLINNRYQKRGEWAETILGSLEDRIIRQQIAPLRREVEQANAVSENLAKALAAVAKGEQLDIPKLLAGVQESARLGSAQGVKESIESIETTVNLKEQA